MTVNHNACVFVKGIIELIIHVLIVSLSLKLGETYCTKLLQNRGSTLTCSCVNLQFVFPFCKIFHLLEQVLNAFAK